MHDDRVFVIHILCTGRPVVGACDHHWIGPHFTVVNDAVLVVAVVADVVGVNLNAIADEVVKLAARDIDLLDHTNRIDKKALIQCHNGIRQVVPREGQQGEFKVGVRRFNLSLNGRRRAIRWRKVEFHFAATHQEIDRRVPGFVLTKLGIGCVGCHAFCTPHFFKLELVRTCQALVLKHDDVVEVAHQLACGQVGRTCQHKRQIRVIRIGHNEFVVHPAAFPVGAGVGDDGRIQAAETDVGVLAFVDPTNLNAIGRCGIEGILQGAVVEIVGRHIQGVLRTHDPRRHRVVHVCAQRQRQFVRGHAVVHRTIEVHVDVP